MSDLDKAYEAATVLMRDDGRATARDIVDAALAEIGPLWVLDYAAANSDMEYGADWYPNKIDRMVQQGVLARVYPEKETT